MKLLLLCIYRKYFKKFDKFYRKKRNIITLENNNIPLYLYLHKCYQPEIFVSQYNSRKKNTKHKNFKTKNHRFT